MVWGMFYGNGSGRLHIVEGSMNAQQYQRVLQSRVAPQMRQWFPSNDGFYQHDRAPCHMARVCTDFLDHEGLYLTGPEMLQI